jgi:foldase protein PrsA
MKKTKILVAVVLVGTLSLIATGCGKKIEVKNGSQVAVSVKGNKITATEFYEKIKEDNISILINLLDKPILEKKYKTDDEENKKIDEQIEQLKTTYGNDENTFKQVLQLYFGVDSESALRENLRLEYKRNLAVNDYIESKITDDEIKTYYNDNIHAQMKASHILISPNVSDNADSDEKAEADSQALEKAKKIIKQLKKGKEFSTLAKKYSDDDATKSKGGDLGYFAYEDMVPEFSEATKNLKVKEYTKKPVKTQYGYHIIYKTAQKDKPALKDVKDDIIEELANKKLEDDKTLETTALVELRKEYKVEIQEKELKKQYDAYIEKNTK